MEVGEEGDYYTYRYTGKTFGKYKVNMVLNVHRNHKAH